ncbi:MAG: (2Fe-2S)-binding protein [Eudoraea sp.]|nr:(2Fe-2S)-binding protein [Eudoraea sp.]
MPLYSLNVNNAIHEVDVDQGTALLWVIREYLGLMGTKYGCGIAQCGVCTVHVDGEPMRACVLPVENFTQGQKIVTIEGLSEDGSHAVQRAWVAAQAPQCGYCQSGQIMQAVALLNKNPSPSVEEIKSGMNGILCRCGTYLRVVKAIQMAAEEKN